MGSTRFHRISMLTTDKDKSDWKIRVRLTRLWQSINSITGDFKGYNMILLDDDKNHIHAFAGMDFVNGMEAIPQEGKIYIISEFNVDDAKYSYSAVSNMKEIYFLKRTNMTEIEEDDEMIPKYKFELAAFNNLEDKVGNIKILTDLMGLVQNKLPMQSRNTPKGPKDILMFDLSDGSATIKVTIWGDFTNTLNEELDRMKDQDNIIIITSCGITKYRKQLQASSLSPSKYYINPDYDAVYDLRHRLNEINVPDNATLAPDCVEKKTPVYDLKEITNLRSSEFKEVYDLYFIAFSFKWLLHSKIQHNSIYKTILQIYKTILQMDVICHVAVCGVEEQSKWWFYICETCLNEVSVINDNYKCDCGKIGSYPDKRFKVSIYVTDPSETIQVYLFDREVRRLTSTNVNSLIGQNIKEGDRDKYPEKLKAVARKNLALTISLTEKNLKHGNTVYFATDVTEEDPTPSQTKPATNKRVPTSDNVANKKKKSTVV